MVQRLLQSGKEREGDDERANAVESTAQREGCDEVVGEDGKTLTGEVDCGGRRTGWEKMKRAEGGDEGKLEE